MKLKDLISPVIAIASIGCGVTASAQVTEADNNIISPLSYIGCDGTSDQPLRLQTVANFRMQFSTNAILRMRLNQTETQTVGPFNNVNTAGFLGISGTGDFFTNPASPGPFTRLHLVDEAVSPGNPGTYAQNFGFRSWMRNGITFTGNSDMAYIGQRYHTNDSTDFVVHWSDNPDTSPWGPDRLKFIFSSGYDSLSRSGSSSFDGLEAMRLFPVNANEAFVGIGDYSAAGGDPTERLDILTGRVRIRQLPTELEMDSTDKYVVVNSDGVLGWRPVTGTPGSGCEWEPFGGSNNLRSAWSGAAMNCPDENSHIGIGLGSNLRGKLSLVEVGNTQAEEFGVHVQFSADGHGKGAGIFSSAICPADTILDNKVLGVDVTAIANGSPKELYGIRSAATINGGAVAERAYGLMASAMNTTHGTVDYLYGVHTSVSGTFGQKRYGIFAKADVGGYTTTSIAGYFEGNVVASGTVTWASDERLKTGIEPLAEASQLLAALQPKRYAFRTQEFPYMGLPEGVRMGLVAQEVQEVLPALVERVVRPSEVDTAGNEVSPEEEYLAMNYMELIPLLIAGHQEQQATIATQQEALENLQGQVADLQQALSACCSKSGGGGAPRSVLDATGTTGSGAERTLSVQPNPFSTGTTIRFTVERAGRVQLFANSSDGRQLIPLQEGNLAEGDYTHEWNTEGLAAGIYYITLLVDGEPLVKKAVRLQ